jgi:hypothetical protein
LANGGENLLCLDDWEIRKVDERTTATLVVVVELERLEQRLRDHSLALLNGYPVRSIA